MGNEKLLTSALEDIIWYDGHYVWLKELRDDMEKHKTDLSYTRDFEEWHTETHTIWMLLVGMYGDWGTSIRSGWIEDIQGCIAFIDEICKESWEADERMV